MKTPDTAGEFPKDLRRVVDAFAYFLPDTDRGDEAYPVIEVDGDFLQAYTNAYRQYARPGKVADLSADTPLFSHEVARDLLSNNGKRVAAVLARLSFELIAQHIDSNGGSISRDELHNYLRVVWYWNEQVRERCEAEVDPYFEELNFALRCLEEHWVETRKLRQSRVIRQYRFPYRFSTW
ncbi:MAG TPA: hypothetical protein PKV96_01520 [Candidatus Saccharimonas sp.]|nr:hypothetical protein [Candidatus Saccharimonas sp.]